MVQSPVAIFLVRAKMNKVFWMRWIANSLKPYIYKHWGSELARSHCKSADLRVELFGTDIYYTLPFPKWIDHNKWRHQISWKLCQKSCFLFTYVLIEVYFISRQTQELKFGRLFVPAIRGHWNDCRALLLQKIRRNRDEGFIFYCIY